MVLNMDISLKENRKPNDWRNRRLLFSFTLKIIKIIVNKFFEHNLKKIFLIWIESLELFFKMFVIKYRRNHNILKNRKLIIRCFQFN